MARINTMINGVKLSDPIINYPSLREFSFEEIDQWLTDNQADTYLIKFYVHYINKTILILFRKIDDQHASIIRRGFKLLEKWEG